MANEEKPFEQISKPEIATVQKDEIGKVIEVNVGYHSQYMKRVNRQEVKLIALIDQYSNYASREKLIETESYLPVQLVTTEKEKTPEGDRKRITEDGFIEEVSDSRVLYLRGKELPLKRYSGKNSSDGSYKNASDFINNNTEGLYNYTGYGEESAEEVNKDLVSGLLKSQLEPIGSISSSLVPESKQIDILNNCPVIVYKIGIHKDELGAAPRSENFLAASLTILPVVIIVPILTFLAYRYKLLWRLVRRIRRFFSNRKTVL